MRWPAAGAGLWVPRTRPACRPGRSHGVMIRGEAVRRPELAGALTNPPIANAASTAQRFDSGIGPSDPSRDEPSASATGPFGSDSRDHRRGWRDREREAPAPRRAGEPDAPRKSYDVAKAEAPREVLRRRLIGDVHEARRWGRRARRAGPVDATAELRVRSFQDTRTRSE
jgi:hypothetical protein